KRPEVVPVVAVGWAEMLRGYAGGDQAAGAFEHAGDPARPLVNTGPQLGEQRRVGMQGEMLRYGPKRLPGAVPFATLRYESPIAPLALRETTQQALRLSVEPMNRQRVRHVRGVPEPECVVQVRSGRDRLPIVQREQVAAVSLPRRL